MPKKDYGNTIIYKIVCKNPMVKDFYIGYTTNLKVRKYNHKSNCNNANGDKYDFLLYKTIRKKGGWDNWEVLPVDKFDCKNVNEAEEIERSFINKYKPNLNDD